MTGPFDTANQRDVFHARIRALELAMKCVDEQIVHDRWTILDLAASFATFVIEGTVPDGADEKPSEATLAYAVAYRALQEEMLARGNA